MQFFVRLVSSKCNVFYLVKAFRISNIFKIKMVKISKVCWGGGMYFAQNIGMYIPWAIRGFSRGLRITILIWRFVQHFIRKEDVKNFLFSLFQEGKTPVAGSLQYSYYSPPASFLYLALETLRDSNVFLLLWRLTTDALIRWAIKIFLWDFPLREALCVCVVYLCPMIFTHAFIRMLRCNVSVL